MNKKIDDEYLEMSEIFKALSHPTRLFIVHSIKDKRMSVKELTELVGVDISTISKHLTILKNSRIIKGEKEKNFIYYTLAIPCVLDFMSCAVNIINKKNK